MRVLIWAMSILFCILVAGATSCKENVSDQKFSAIAHRNEYNEFLIKKVHASNWKIGYTFIDQKNECEFDDFKNNPYKQQLEDKIKEVIQLWLSPLKDKKNIISNENILIEPLIATNVLKSNTGHHSFVWVWRNHVSDKILALYDLLIFFRCYSHKYGGGMVLFSEKGVKPLNLV